MGGSSLAAWAQWVCVWVCSQLSEVRRRRQRHSRWIWRWLCEPTLGVNVRSECMWGARTSERRRIIYAWDIIGLYLSANSTVNQITTRISIRSRMSMAWISYSSIVEKTLKARQVNTIKNLRRPWVGGKEGRREVYDIMLCFFCVP